MIAAMVGWDFERADDGTAERSIIIKISPSFRRNNARAERGPDSVCIEPLGEAVTRK
jgi:hypothetical protein